MDYSPLPKCGGVTSEWLLDEANILKDCQVSKNDCDLPEKKTYNYFLLELSSAEVFDVTHNAGLKKRKKEVRMRGKERGEEQ